MGLCKREHLTRQTARAKRGKFAALEVDGEAFAFAGDAGPASGNDDGIWPSCSNSSRVRFALRVTLLRGSVRTSFPLDHLALKLEYESREPGGVLGSERSGALERPCEPEDFHPRPGIHALPNIRQRIRKSTGRFAPARFPGQCAWRYSDLATESGEEQGEDEPAVPESPSVWERAVRAGPLGPWSRHDMPHRRKRPAVLADTDSTRRPLQTRTGCSLPWLEGHLANIWRWVHTRTQ